MKNGIVKILVASVLTLLMSPVYAALPADVMCCGVEIPAFCGGYFLDLTTMYWRPRVPHLDFSLFFPTDDFFEGVFNSIDPSYKWGYRIAFGYTFPCTGNDVQFTFTHFKEADQKRVLPLGGQVLSAFLGDVDVVVVPPVLITDVDPSVGFTLVSPIPPVVVIPPIAIPVDTTVSSSSAEAKFDEEFIDFDLGQYVLIGPSFRIRGFGGLRYINLENSLLASISENAPPTVVDTSGTVDFTFDGPEGPVIGTVGVQVNYTVSANLEHIINQKSRTTGVGPRFGFDTSYHLGYGIGLVGGVSGSLLVGRILSSLLVETQGGVTAVINAINVGFGTPPIANATVSAVIPSIFTSAFNASLIQPRRTRIIPNIDAKLGLDYTYQFCYNKSTSITLEAGYMLSYFWNVIDRLTAVGITQPEFEGPHVLDLGLGGFYITLGLTF